jgi:nucleoside-diphosphate-sugar epimerase
VTGGRPAPDPRADLSSAGGDLCLVTGATGFIGGHVVRRLVGDGYRVRCLARATSDTSALDALELESVRGDITNADTLVSAADGCRFVLHCAALVSDWATSEEIRQVNVVGTRNLLAASAAASAERFIHFSTTDVYGYPAGSKIDEDHTPARFANWYARTKVAAEEEVRRAQRENALDVVIMRPATVYGPRSDAVVGEIALAIRAGHMLMVGGGRAVAGLSYVENVVDAAVLALHSSAARNQAFNVSDGLDITWKRFLSDLADGLGCQPPRLTLPYGVAYAIGFSLEHGYRLLRRVAGIRLPPLLSRQAVQVLGRDQDFSNRKAREVLGWEPRVPYATGLDATIEWLREDYLVAR